jgi:hypothetical protein
VVSGIEPNDAMLLKPFVPDLSLSASYGLEGSGPLDILIESGGLGSLPEGDFN